MSASGRPGERRANARTAVVWDALRPILEGEPLDVVDIGGGTGVSAVRVAEAGHRVCVVDPSPDALAALARRAREVGVEVDARQGDLSGLLDVVGVGSADVVLCHGVLEVVPDPAAALGAIHDALRPGGHLSLLVAQRSAAVLARAMAGHFAQAKALLDQTTSVGRSGRRFSQDEAAAALAAAGFTITAVHGVRVFTDLVPGSLLDLEPGATTDLVELEQAVAGRADYLPLATQLHFTARR
ncbi:class I SAM-dependent methyltransferase [Nocardioides cheoyonin]|uniref:class I SAM-dependent methyltransferase n=1 Tax=Nocardioides cheoyonin TaxID=3156615 RepID=UPI0032B43DB0